MDDMFRMIRTARRFGRALNGIAAEPVERACGLTSKELVMLHAFEGGSTHPHELVDRTGTAAPLVTRTLDRLSELGYVERRPDTVDRRRVVVVVTDAGAEAAAAGWAALGEALERALDGVPHDTFARIADDMEALSESVEAHRPSDTSGGPA
jgi:MarR family transcriptional regulator, organic hydroperoxide resistance regulator